MAIPVTAAGARVTGATTRNSIRHVQKRMNENAYSKSDKAQIRNLRKTTNQIAERTSDQIQSAYKVVDDSNHTEESSDTDFHIIKRARVIRASWPIVMFILPFYFLQLFFALLSIGGAGAEIAGENFLWGLGALVIPGLTIFSVSWIFAATIGFVSMIAASLIYTLQGIAWWKGFGLVFFCLFLTFSLAPFLNIFPWLGMWMCTVIYAQK